MIDAYLVTRKEHHIDDGIWICLDKDDAILIANDVVKYWMSDFNEDDDLEIDRECYGDSIFSTSISWYEGDHIVTVKVSPIKIREKGETDK